VPQEMTIQNKKQEKKWRKKREKKTLKKNNNANEIAKHKNAQCSQNTNDQFFFNESPL